MGEGREPLPSDLVERLSELAQQGRRSEAAELFLTRAVAVPPHALAGAAPIVYVLEGHRALEIDRVLAIEAAP